MIRSGLLLSLLLCCVTVGRAAEPVTNSIGMQLVPIAPGTFTMGQDGPPLEDYLRQKRFGEIYKATNQIDFDEKPAHQVTISRPFLMGVTEVTVGQYRRFDPVFKKGDPRAKDADETSGDLGATWQWQASEFPVVSNTQRPAMLRLAEGPILLCSFTDQARTPLKERQGLSFKSAGGDYTGVGLYAAVSYEEG